MSTSSLTRLSLLLMLVLLAGCGLKGDLYLSDADPDAEQQIPMPEDEDSAE